MKKPPREIVELLWQKTIGQHLSGAGRKRASAGETARTLSPSPELVEGEGASGRFAEGEFVVPAARRKAGERPGAAEGSGPPGRKAKSTP